MCYPVCGVMHIKEPLLLIGKSSPCGSSGFPLSLSEWSFTICLMPSLSASLNKAFPSFLLVLYWFTIIEKIVCEWQVFLVGRMYFSTKDLQSSSPIDKIYGRNSWNKHFRLCITQKYVLKPFRSLAFVIPRLPPTEGLHLL